MKKQTLLLALSMAIFGTIAPFVRMTGLASGEVALYRAVLASLFIGLFLLITRQHIDFMAIKKQLPIVIKEIVAAADKYNTEELAKNPNATIVDVSDMVELSQIIMKKKLKKFEKEGVDAALAFDALSVIPKDDVLASSQNYRIHMLMDTLYEHAKSKTVPFATIMNILVGEEYYPMFTVFALLERKEKFGTLTDAQKVLYLDISNWVFNTMEKDLTKDQLSEVVNTYIRSRRRDESQNKDGNRRYALSTLSETDYPRISAFIKKLIANDDTLKKYL